MPPKIYFNDQDVRISYDVGFDRYWLEIQGRSLSFAGKGFDNFFGLEGADLRERLTAVHPEVDTILHVGDLETIARGLKTVAKKEAKEQERFKKLMTGR